MSLTSPRNWEEPPDDNPSMPCHLCDHDDEDCPLCNGSGEFTAEDYKDFQEGFATYGCEPAFEDDFD